MNGGQKKRSKNEKGGNREFAQLYNFVIIEFAEDEVCCIITET